MVSYCYQIPRHRKLLYFSLFLCFSLVIALTGTELLMRVIAPLKDPWILFWPRGYYIPAPGCNYHPSKNFKPTWMQSLDGQTRNLVYSNSLGMRDVEPPPPDGRQLRILSLGCSYTEGLGVTDPDQPWPRQLEHYLNAAGDRPGNTPVVVMNGGVVGFNTFQQVSHGIQLTPAAKPDVWLLAFMGGDFGMWLRNSYGPAGQYRLQWGSIWAADHLDRINAGRSAFSLKLTDYSYLWRWTCLIQANWQPGSTTTTCAIYGQHYDEASLDALTFFKQSAQRMGVRPVVVYLPPIEEIAQALHGKEPYMLARTRELCRRLQLEFHEMRSPMVAEARRLNITNLSLAWKVSVRESHYNAACNKVFARLLAQELKPDLAQWIDKRHAGRLRLQPSSGNNAPNLQRLAKSAVTRTIL